MPKKKPATIAKQSMVDLGIYKPEFDPVIKVYGEIIEQYNELTARFIASGLAFEEKTASGSKKAPIVTTLEALRKDILAYSSQLGLTPQGLLKADDGAFKKKKVGLLTAALEAASE